MKIETLKSIVLTCLIGLSLALTLGIWNYQPDSNLEDSEDNTIEAKIGGIKETKKSIIKPSHIIYHINGIHQGLKEKQLDRALYQEMQSWSIYDFISRTGVESLAPIQSNQYMEVVFPTAIPSEVIQDLFTTNQDLAVPGRVFDRMYIVLDENQAEEQVQFVDTGNKSKIVANIQNFTEKRGRILQYYNGENGLAEYLVYNGFNDTPIYISKDPIVLERHPFQAKQIATTPLRNVLFPNPSAVRSNDEDILGPGEVLTDAQRKMFVSKNYYMEFTNPIQVSFEESNGRDLITDTLKFVNDHDGWTTEIDDEYTLYDLNLLTRTVTYRLNYQGYPVFEKDKLSTITVSMRNQNIYQYNRPLIHLKGSLYGQQVTMPSGEKVISEINRSKQFSAQIVRDIKIGYKLEEQLGAQYVFTLIPTWFIKGNFGWRELVFEELPVEGGEGNAVGTN